MRLISLNSTYLDKKILWNLSFDNIVQLPQVRFKIEEANDSTLYKHVSLSGLTQQGNHRITGFIDFENLFAPKEGEDTTELDIEASYIIREITVSYPDGANTITSSIQAEFPLDELSTNADQADQLQPQEIRITQGDDLHLYLPKFLGRSTDSFSIYFGETIDECSWEGFANPTRKTREDIAKLLEKDKEGRLTDAIEHNGQVFIVSEKDSEGSLKAIQPTTLVLLRTNYAIAWTVEYNLTTASPIASETTITGNSRWFKAPPKMETVPLQPQVGESFYNERPEDFEDYSVDTYTSFIDDSDNSTVIEQEYTKITLPNAAKRERFLL